jgi:hypothetical protein
MIALLISGISVLALLQFFVSYCHALIAESRSYKLSEQTREICGVTTHATRSDEFKRLLQLIAVCPEPNGDQNQVRAISLYFGLLSLIRTLLGWIKPAVGQWIDSECNGCAQAAIVMLDRRIAYNRLLMARQMGTQL